MEGLSIPEPALSLLKRVHKLLDSELTPTTPGRSGWALGGGTALSARWKHRVSRDLDIYVHPHTVRGNILSGDEGGLWRQLQEAGATKKELEPTPTIYFPEGKMEILNSRPMPDIGAADTEVETGRIRVLSSAQILTAKLRHRGLSAPVRDLYDIAVARKCEPMALTVAANMLTERTTQTVSGRWKARRNVYRDEGAVQLTEVPEEYRAIQEDPAEHARAALVDTRYHALTVEVSKNRIIVRTHGEFLGRQLVYPDIGAARTGFERDGINGALAAAGHDPGRVREAANNALAAGKRDTVLKIEAKG